MPTCVRTQAWITSKCCANCYPGLCTTAPASGELQLQRPFQSQTFRKIFRSRVPRSAREMFGIWDLEFSISLGWGIRGTWREKEKERAGRRDRERDTLLFGQDAEVNPRPLRTRATLVYSRASRTVVTRWRREEDTEEWNDRVMPDCRLLFQLDKPGPGLGPNSPCSPQFCRVLQGLSPFADNRPEDLEKTFREDDEGIRLTVQFRKCFSQLVSISSITIGAKTFPDNRAWLILIVAAFDRLRFMNLVHIICRHWHDRYRYACHLLAHIVRLVRNTFKPATHGCQRRLIQRVTVRGIELTLRSNWIWRRRWSG